MLHTEPVGRYVVAVCTNIACMLAGAYELSEHAEQRSASGSARRRDDGMFTIEEAECLAGCDTAPCVQVNHRFFGPLDAAGFDQLVDDLAAGRLDETVPPHGVLCRVERTVGLPARPRSRRPPGTTRDHRAAPIVTAAPRPRRLAHPRALPRDRRLRRSSQGAHDDGRSRLPRRSTRRACSVGAAPASRPAGSGPCCGRQPTTYLVVNGDESEPATFKDHLLIERDPHQIIEGTIIAAYAIGASQAFIFCRGEFALGLERLQQALQRGLRSTGRSGANIFGSDFSLDLVIHPGAGAYICGEETALLESLEGKRGFPRIKPPYFPAAIGLYGEPTVVNNVETCRTCPGS